MPLWKDLNLLNMNSINSMEWQDFQDEFCSLRVPPFTNGLFGNWSIFIFRNLYGLRISWRGIIQKYKVKGYTEITWSNF